MDAADATLLLRLAALNTAYGSTIDRDALEDWPDFFTENSFYRITTAANHARGLAAGVVYADSRDMLHDRVFALRRANIYERQAYRHVIGMPAILGHEADGSLRAEAPFLVVRTMRDGTMSLFAAGRYLDRLVEREGRLLFAAREVICDSPNFDTLLAIPL
ncbi:MAG: nuclear transport factor 2 family protein [Acetobacteraceae bacterium]|nr:nuclear transport factor 2 family protein [Acetobacteraceae bacterium]